MKIIAISDQHGHLPEIPECDLLIVAGDLCPDNFGSTAARHDPERQWRWFESVWLPWRERQPAAHCLVTWGNHDYCGERHRNAGDGATDIVCDREVQIAGLRVYLTPWSNQFMRWAFMRQPAELARCYEQIPEGIDILVSHQPPLGYGSNCTYLDPRDGKMKTEHVGSVELLAAIQRAKPGAVVCGHVHSGYGAYSCDGIPIYNVSVVDEGYSLVHLPTVIPERQQTHEEAMTTNVVRLSVGDAHRSSSRKGI